MPAHKNDPVSPDSEPQHTARASTEASSQEEASDQAADIQERMYIDDLIKSGKAAVAENGKLPPGATHEIVGKDANGRPIVVRRRFAAY